ncbi:hypothetical protein THII_2466 [Thioploca ingrica]|uniref:Uncharacterized protein n=1 Tax=Thioploca ingrica TaxID=40754 RepID=A0A090AF95_9GAMM|nr:hypothetical protein THII_2466 [Thioploca ingrica]
MIRHFIALLSVIIVMFTHIGYRVQAKQPTTTPDDRTSLFQILFKAGVLHKDRQLVHFSHVCNLQIKGKWFPVVDVMELVKGATTPRGINKIVVLNPARILVQTIEYTTERPLFCKYNQLFVFGNIMIDNTLPEGNVFSFTNEGHHVEISQVDINELPLPNTGETNFILQ